MVDGSERTFICVDEVPSTGVAVGWGGGRSGVSDGDGKSVGGNVEVMMKAVGVVAPISLTCISHPEQHMARMMRRAKYLYDTIEL